MMNDWSAINFSRGFDAWGWNWVAHFIYLVDASSELSIEILPFSGTKIASIRLFPNPQPSFAAYKLVWKMVCSFQFHKREDMISCVNPSFANLGSHLMWYSRTLQTYYHVIHILEVSKFTNYHVPFTSQFVFAQRNFALLLLLLFVSSNMGL